ncbi:DUF6744 family protein [Amycolatopsis sp. NPDC059657]|uniref:DUF6744 family protein n=1 Tax=Amycolatopsis sp. NPDC059657 TaxID=3346899 RepID=UPI00366E6048
MTNPVAAEDIEPEADEPPTGDAVFDRYTESVSDGTTPLLGHLVLYSIVDSEVTQPQLANWFRQLGLDQQMVPPELRAVDAFERITGRDGVREVYALDGESELAKRRRRREPPERQATLMIRNVARDKHRIERHIVREVRDQTEVKLSYDTHLGSVVFERDNAPSSGPGDGQLVVTPDNKAINKLPEAERKIVRKMLGEIESSYQWHLNFLTGDKLRSMIRRYIESLSAVRVRKTGGVYFVYHQHSATLGRLRQLVEKFGSGSHLVRVPLADQDEMREMVVTAVTTKAAEDLNKLSAEIAAAQRNGVSDEEIAELYRRFRDVQAATTDHSTRLSTSLDDTEAAMNLVKAQLGSLLATAGTEDADESAAAPSVTDGPQCQWDTHQPGQDRAASDRILWDNGGATYVCADCATKVEASDQDGYQMIPVRPGK